MTNLKIAALCLACMVFLAVGLVSLRAYQAPPASSAGGAAASDELKRALEGVKAAEADVARLEAAVREKAARAERYKETVTEYYSKLGYAGAALNQQKAKVTAAEAALREARAKVEAARKQMPSLIDEVKKDPKKRDATTVELIQAMMKRYEAELTVAEAKLQVEKLTLDDLTRKAESAKERKALGDWVSGKAKAGSLESRVESLEKAVEELRAELKALRPPPTKSKGPGLFDPKRSTKISPSGTVPDVTLPPPAKK